MRTGGSTRSASSGHTRHCAARRKVWATYPAHRLTVRPAATAAAAVRLSVRSLTA
nr:MAG TPA: hypothetical protein [Caudoviricetes sp.]